MAHKSSALILSISLVFVLLSTLGSVPAANTELVSPNEELYGDFGSSVSGIPDVNGDGCGDVVVGAPLASPGPSPDSAGRACLFHSFRPNIDVSPSSLAFGSQEIDSGPTGTMTATITNDGSVVLTFTGSEVDITGPDTAEFAIAADSGEDPLAPAGSRTVDVVFDPSSVGVKSASLTVTSNDPDEPTVQVGLTGTGYENTPTPTNTSTYTPTVTPTNTETFTVAPTPIPTATPVEPTPLPTEVSLSVERWSLYDSDE